MAILNGNSAPYRGRVRTGCLACRASKVRCDEQHPTCKRCTRQQKTCVYKGRATTTNKAQSVPETISSVQTTAPFTCASIQASDGRPPPLLAVPSGFWRSSGLEGSTGATDSSFKRPPQSALSPLIAENIYLCTTIDYLATLEGASSYTHFRLKFESPFITPYDPTNWSLFREFVLQAVDHDATVATAATAAEAVHRARVNCLPHAQPLKLYAAACDGFQRRAVYCENADDLDYMILALFLLVSMELMLPHEALPGVLLHTDQALTTIIRRSLASESASPLNLRLASWLLICHAAARRSGNRGILSPELRSLLVQIFEEHSPLPSLLTASNKKADETLLGSLSDPLFTYYVRTQILSGEVAELSHYHRNRTTGADQEEVSILMSDIRARLDALWQKRPALMHQSSDDLYAQFTSTSIVTVFGLLSTLCKLVYHTELVEIGRNLSHEQSITAEARAHLVEMRKLIEKWSAQHGTHSAFLRALLLIAIESPLDDDSAWAVAEMHKIHDPICYSEFFANFSEGLAEAQRRVGRRVTTRWFSMQTFGMQLPFL